MRIQGRMKQSQHTSAHVSILKRQEALAYSRTHETVSLNRIQGRMKPCLYKRQEALASIHELHEALASIHALELDAFVEFDVRCGR